MYRSTLMRKAMRKLPRLNPDLCNGLAYKQSNLIVGFIDDVLRCASASFPPGLEFIESRPATPEEQLRDMTRLKRNKRQYEVAPSDLYHRVYIFHFEGRPLKLRYLQLPYIRRGGVVRINGSSFVVSPVLADNIFSVEPDKIYMPVTRSKITFQSLPYYFVMDDQTVPTDIVHAKVFRLTSPKLGNNARKTMLFHYILCKHGLREGLRKYFGVHAEVGNDEINTENYPADEWVICRTRGKRPAVKGYPNYQPCPVRIAIKRSEYTADLIPALGAFYYIVDHEPDLIDDQVDNPMLWRRLLPRFIKNEVVSDRKAMEEMEAHIASVDSYLDDLVRRKLVHEGVPCRDIYDVFMEIVKTYTMRTLNCDPANMHGKQLETVRFLMYDVVYSISKLLFELVKLSGDRLRVDFIERVFDQGFKTNIIQKINSRHGEVNTLESATDCLPLAVTKGLVSQSKASDARGGKAKHSSEMTDPSFALHASQCTVNTYLFISKSAPSARESLNHFMELGPHNEVVPDERYLHELEELQAMIQTQ